MNYEELLAAKSDGKQYKTQLPLGEYCRQQVDGKYCGVVSIRSELTDNVFFTEALKREAEWNGRQHFAHQLHFSLQTDERGRMSLEVEPGTYFSLDHLLRENPAVIAEKGFLENTFQALVEVTESLHEAGISHLCYSPKSVLVRRGDHSVMLLSHGSFYQHLRDQRLLYGDDADFVAPEVLDHGTIDERSDVYGIGRLMEALFAHTEMPVTFRKVITKAVSQAPEDRYATPHDMLKAVTQRSSVYKTALSLTGATIVALLVLGIYLESMPDTPNIEYVKPAERLSTDDLLDDGFSPEELGVMAVDSATTDSMLVTQKAYQEKAEAIFRKKYEREADRILSKIYNTESMSYSEKRFSAESQSTLKELMELQQQMGEEACLTPERSQLLASEIIDRISNKKKKELQVIRKGMAQSEE